MHQLSKQQLKQQRNGKAFGFVTVAIRNVHYYSIRLHQKYFMNITQKDVTTSLKIKITDSSFSVTAPKITKHSTVVANSYMYKVQRLKH